MVWSDFVVVVKPRYRHESKKKVFFVLVSFSHLILNPLRNIFLYFFGYGMVFNLNIMWLF